MTDEIDYTKMNGPEMLAACSDNAMNWATAFQQIIVSKSIAIDEGLMVGWFANAIEHSGDERRWRLDRLTRERAHEGAVVAEIRARHEHNDGLVPDEALCQYVYAAAVRDRATLLALLSRTPPASEPGPDHIRQAPEMVEAPPAGVDREAADRILCEHGIGPMQASDILDAILALPAAPQDVAAVIDGLNHSLLAIADKRDGDECREAIQKAIDLLGRKSAPQVGGWMGIETAPKDGTHILVWVGDDSDIIQIKATAWAHGCWQVECLTGPIFPTFWMPVPAPPASPQGGKGGV